MAEPKIVTTSGGFMQCGKATAKDVLWVECRGWGNGWMQMLDRANATLLRDALTAALGGEA